MFENIVPTVKKYSLGSWDKISVIEQYAQSTLAKNKRVNGTSGLITSLNVAYLDFPDLHAV